MANIISVAKYILEQRGAMTTMKLQKLCYYSQAWSLAWDDKPLFDEDFKHGQMVRFVLNFSDGIKESLR